MEQIVRVVEEAEEEEDAAAATTTAVTVVDEEPEGEPESDKQQNRHFEEEPEEPEGETEQPEQPQESEAQQEEAKLPVVVTVQQQGMNTTAAAAAAGEELATSDHHPLSSSATSATSSSTAAAVVVAALPTTSFVSDIPEMPKSNATKEEIVIAGVAPHTGLKDVVVEGLDTRLQTTKQALKDFFSRKPDRSHDESVAAIMADLKRIQQICARTVYTLSTYVRQLEDLRTHELTMSRFLQEKGVRDASTVGGVMKSFAGAQRALADQRKRGLQAAVTDMLDAVRSFSKVVVKDMELTLKKVDKARQKYDTQRCWLKDVEKVKEKKEAKHKKVTEAMHKAEREWNSLKEAAQVKLTMLDDKRMQIFAHHLRLIHDAQADQASHAAAVLDAASSQQETLGTAA